MRAESNNKIILIT